MISYVYYGPEAQGSLPPLADSWVKAASSYGNLCGQLAFGILGDVLGRKKVYGMELIILIVGALGSAMSFNINGNPLIVLGIWRFILGIGVGGDYPVSSVIASEFAGTKFRGTLIAMVFAMQGFGILLGALVAVITLKFFEGAIEKDIQALDWVWRILAGFGIVPALSAVYFRLTITESPRYTIEKGNVGKAHRDAQNYLSDDPTFSPFPLDAQNDSVPLVSSSLEPTPNEPSNSLSYFEKFSNHFKVWRNMKVLIACCMCWFLLDIGYYGTNLNTSVVLSAIGYTDKSTPFNDVWSLACGQLIIALAGNFPGYFFTVYFVDKWGRKPIQFMGFAALFIGFATLSIFYSPLKNSSIGLFVFIYSLCQFFFNFGPNATTFIIPSEVFPTSIRSTSHGISSASGKLGALIAAQGFAQLANVGGKNQSMWFVLSIFSICCLGGFFFTFWLPETNGLSLEEINNQEYREVKDVRSSQIELTDMQQSQPILGS